MAKLILDPVTAINSVSTINTNFDRIEAEFQDKALYRDNPPDETNTVRNDLDLDGNDIFNVNALYADTLVVDGIPIENTDLVAIPQLIIDVDILQAEMDEAQADILANAATEQANNLASLRTTGLPIEPISEIDDRAGKFLAFDAIGNPVSSTGTGADIGLRTDLAASNGGSLLGFKVNDVNSVERTLEDKALERITVFDFGAVGDGITDDTVAFQNAFNYAANRSEGGTSLGMVLYVPPGEYMLSNTIVMPSGKPFILRGEGAGSKLRKTNGSGPIIRCESGSKIQDLFFKGPTVGTSNGIYCLGANTGIIEGCYFQNQTTGIQMELSYAMEIISNTFDVCYLYGIIATTSAHNTMLERNNFFTCGVAGGGQAIRFDVASDNLGIKDNDFEFCNVNIQMAACNGVEITGNYMEYHEVACFNFLSGNQGVIIEANWIAIGDPVGGGDVATIQNITGGRFVNNVIYNQSVAFTANALVGFDVGLNAKFGTGTIAPAPWNNALLQNSWTHQINYSVPAFIKDNYGWVHIKGAVVGGIAPAVIFTLPVGFRPDTIKVFPTMSSNGPCTITINTNGDVVPTVAAVNNPGLDGISFYVGN